MGNSKSKADTWGGREPEKVEAPEGGVEVEPVDLETIRADNLKNKKQDDKISKVWLNNFCIKNRVLLRIIHPGWLFCEKCDTTVVD